MLILFSISGTDSALASSDYLQTDKEIYFSGEMVTIFINVSSGSYIEIETPSARYSLFGEVGNSQKFFPSDVGIYTIILLDDKNIIGTKSFEVVLNNTALSENNMRIENFSIGNYSSYEDRVNSAISHIINSSIANSVANGSVNYGEIYSDKNVLNYVNNSALEISGAVRINGESFISTDKREYFQNEIVRISLLAEETMEKIIISSETDEYLFLMEEQGDISKKDGLNFIPDKSGIYVVSAKPLGKNVYYDVYFYVKGINAADNYRIAPDNISNSISEIYRIINERQIYAETIAPKNSSFADITGRENISVSGDVGISNSKGEKINAGVYFYSDKVQEVNASAKGTGSGSSVPEYPGNAGSKLLKFEKYNVEIFPENLPVKKLRVNNFVYMGNTEIGMETIPKEKYEIPQRVIAESYAINMEDMIFTDAIASVTAKGEELWKCALWNFTERECYGEWEKIQDIVPGREYNILLYPGDPGYIETYTTFQSSDMDMIALDNTTIVIAWVDNATNNNISFQVWNINGTAITSKIPVDATGGSTSRVSLAPINTTDFILAIFDQPQNNIDFFTYDRNGNSIVGRTNAAATVGAYTDVKICQLGDRFPLAYSRTSNRDAELRIYYNNGTLGTGTTQIDSAMSPELANQQLVSCAAVNSTAFAYSWFDDGSNDMTFTIRSNTGTSIVAATDYDTDVGETAQISSTSLGDNMYVAAYYDSTDDDITINVRRVSGTSTTSIVSTDIDINAGTSSIVDVATILMTTIPNFAVAWFDTSDNTIKAGVYNQSGSQVTAPYNVSTTPNSTFPMVAVVGYEPLLGIGLCNGTFAVAYTNRTGGSVISKYWFNGSAWDGICPDYVPPVVILDEPANDSNITSDTISFNFTATDNRILLPNCSIWSNFTGAWQRNTTIYNVTSGLKTNITIYGMGDGTYIWNVNCSDNSSNTAFAPANYTVRVNSILPRIRGQMLNNTVINQSEKIRFNVTITDSFGINDSKITIQYPNGTEINYTLNISGNEHYYVINETIQLGTYYITRIWAKDSLGQENYNSTPNLQFEVTPSPPAPFSLTNPPNNTESQILTPTFVWGQTVEPNFANYSILVSKDPSFSTVDFTYNTFVITATSFLSTYALDSNTVYYWMVIARDIFGNRRNSTQIYTYIVDTQPPSIALNTPGNNSFWTTTDVLFNYTPTDTNTLQSCTLYGNFSGTFSRNETNTSIEKDSPNYFNISLGEGTYLWAVYCNDTALNGRYSAENYTFFLDLSGPSVLLTSPSEGALENNTNNVVFKANASDKYTNISSCSLIINGTEERTRSPIYNYVEFNFNHFLLNGNYTWRVDCTDTNGFISSSETRNIEVSVVDRNPPLITMNYPAPNEYVKYSSIAFNYTPEDATGIENCSIYIDGTYNKLNETEIQNFVYNYFTVQGLSEGVHTWRISCYDNSSEKNYGTSSTRTFYVDTINPNVTLVSPGNSTSSDKWYFPGENYRKKHNLTGSSSGNLFNYTVNIIAHYGAGSDTGGDVYLGSRSRTDFGDIRFSDGNNSIELNYYMEEMVDSDYASFWVKIPYIDSSSGGSFYIYYGDSGLSTSSNGENSFEFFDDFSSGLDKWTVDSQNTDAITINELLGVSGSAGAVHYPDSSQTKNAYYDTRMMTKNYNFTDGAMDYDIYISGTSRAIHQFGWRVDNLSFGSGYALRLQTSAADGGFFRFTGGSWTAFGTAYPAISAGTWYHVSVNISSSNYAATVNPGSAITSSDSTKTSAGAIVSHVHATGTDYYVVIDNVRVRKYALPEPGHTGWSAEENQLSMTEPEYADTSSVTFTYIPSDTNIANCSLYGNFSGTFSRIRDEMAPQSDQQNSFTETLADGLYVWNVGCYDLSSRTAFAPINYAVKVDTSPPQYSGISVSPPSGSSYNPEELDYFNVTWTDNFNVSEIIIEENFSGTPFNTTLTGVSGIYSFTAGNISAGQYYYKWYAFDDVNNLNETGMYLYEIEKSNASINLSLNGQQENITTNETNSVTINASMISPAYGFLNLYIDEVLAVSGFAPLINSTILSEPGIHNVTSEYPATRNYSYVSITKFVIVNDTISPSVQLLSPKNNGFVGLGSATLQYNVSDKSDISSCTLYINGIMNQSNSSVEKYSTQYFVVNLELGNYNWSVFCQDNNTNTGYSETRNFSAVNINTIKTYVNTTKPQFEKGEPALINTYTQDIFDNGLTANVTTHIIKGITPTPWWNESWKYRKQIIVNNTVGRDRTETIELNISELNGTASCNEIRIVKNTTVSGMTIHEVLPAEIISGVNVSCIVRFNIDLAANKFNLSNWFVYYGNPSASSQGVTVNKSGVWVQRGYLAGTTAALTATIENVPIDKTFIIHTQASGSSAPTINQFTSGMSLTNEITFTRYGSGTSAMINWQAVTGSDFTVQRNAVAFAAGTAATNVSINSVNTSKAFILVDGRVNSGTASTNNRGNFIARFVNSTTIEIERRTTGTAATAGWQVVEWNNSRVYSGNLSFTGTSGTVTVSSVNLSRAVLFFGSSVSGATGVGANMIAGNITGSTSLSFERTLASGTVNITWFLVELPEEFSVQNSSVSMSSDQNIAISSVDFSKAFHVQSWSSTGTTSTTYTNTYILANLTNTSNILLNKQTATNTHVVRVYTINTYSGAKGFGTQQELIQTNTSQTDVLGYYLVFLNTSNLSYYNYSAVSAGNKSNFVNDTNYAVFEVVPDKTKPNVTLNSPDDFIERGVGYLNFSYTPYDINLFNCSLYVNTNGTFNILAVNNSPLNSQVNQFNNVYIDLGLHEWNVGCRDEEGNLGFAPQNRTLNITGPDLRIRTDDLYFGDEERVEGVNITIYLNLTNAGLTAVNSSFIVQFFRNDPDFGGTQIGRNITVQNMSAGETVVINTTEYVLSPGRNIIYARVDPDNIINETIEINNKISNNVSVVLYQYFYGNISGRIITADKTGLSFIDFKNVTSNEGAILFADADSSFAFSDLQALTRNKLNQLVGDDFSNLDAAMGTTGFDDSIKSIWGGGTDNPIQTKPFNISNKYIVEVPVANSTITSDFVTGILWDTNDDGGNLQYDSSDREDIVFVANINQNRTGMYGLYDAEIKIPATLRNYKGSNDRVYMYVELT